MPLSVTAKAGFSALPAARRPAPAPAIPDAAGASAEADSGACALLAAEDDDDPDEIEDLKPASELPPMYAHGDPDPRPLKNWLVKGLIPACGHRSASRS